MTDKQKWFVRELRRTYADVLTERIPDDLTRLLNDLR